MGSVGHIIYNFNKDDDGIEYANTSDYDIVDRNQLLNDEDFDLNLLLNDVPKYAYNFEFAEYVHMRNKNLCSGYFCSFIPLINKNNILNIPIHNNC